MDKEETSILLFGQNQIHCATDLPADVKASITAIDCDKSDYCNSLFPNRYRTNLRFLCGGPEKLLEDAKKFQNLFFVRSSFNDQSIENLLTTIENSSNCNSQIVLEDLFSVNSELSANLGFGFEKSGWNYKLKLSSLECLSLKEQSSEFLQECQIISGPLKKAALKNPCLVDHFNKLNLLISDLKNGTFRSQRLVLRKTKKTSSLTWTDKPEEEQCNLIMLSGGLDSIFILWDALANTKRKILAHHVELINGENRHQIETEACNKVVDWLKIHCRDFHYNSSTIDRTNLSHFGMDLAAVGFEAGLAAQSYSQRTNETVDFWQIGHCLDEGHGWPMLWANVLNCAKAGSFPFDPPRYLERELIPKAEQRRLMPEEIVAFSWGCRRPIEENGLTKACGLCKTCKSRQAIGLD